MASQERGLSLPVPGVGERLKKIVDALKNRGQHGIMQASVIAPEKPKTEVPSDLTQEELKQLIPPSPESSKEPPKNKKPLIQRMIGNLGVRIGLGVLAAGGAGYAAREAISDNIPALSRPAEKSAETGTSFDKSLEKGIISDKNSILVSDLSAVKQDLSSSQKSPSSEKQDYILYPIAGLPPSGEVKYSKDLTGKNPMNPIFPEDIRQEAIENNVKNILRLPIFKGQDIVFLLNPSSGAKEAKVSFATDLERIGSTPNNAYETAKITYTDSSGKFHQIQFWGTLFTPLIEGTPLQSKYSKMIGGAIKPTYDVVHVMRALQDGEITISTMGKPSESSPGSEYYPTELDLIILRDPSSQQDKLVIAKPDIAP